jgi:hypothetical protein
MINLSNDRKRANNPILGKCAFAELDIRINDIEQDIPNV